ncbi:MAG: ABC transporter ATP-binding protein [Lachnospiraceae bacterium]|nr:ABC transporter ATP-binding protein [Lachnospiraceae bacterium]
MRLVLDHVSASYDTASYACDVLKDISFCVEAGMRVAVLGANGSGKTSLLRAVTGSLPYRGSITFDGLEVREMKAARVASCCAFLEQTNHAYFPYTVEETVSQGRYLHAKKGLLFGEMTPKDREMTDEMLRFTGLTDVSERPIDTLSGGQLQRVFLARTLVQEAPFILLDEPASHLDLKYRAELIDFLKSWSLKETVLPDGSAHQNTLLGVFHDLTDARRLATHVLLLKEGRLAAYGEKEDLLADRTLLEEVFDFDVLGYLFR